MDNGNLAQTWMQRADAAGVLIFAREGEVWVGTTDRSLSQQRVDRFREALNADPEGKAALLALLNPVAEAS